MRRCSSGDALLVVMVLTKICMAAVWDRWIDVDQVEEKEKEASRRDGMWFDSGGGWGARLERSGGQLVILIEHQR